MELIIGINDKNTMEPSDTYLDMMATITPIIIDIKANSKNLKYNIELTQKAYGLSTVEERIFPVSQNLTKEDINLMRELKSQMDESIDKRMLDQYYKLQVDFHNLYINKSNNEELIQLLNQLKMRFIRQGYDSNEKLVEIFTETNREHEVIIDLMEEKDADKLEHYLKTVHWDVEYSNLDVI